MSILEVNTLSIHPIKFGKTQQVTSSYNRVYYRQVLDLSLQKDRFQYLNTLCSDGKKLLLVGSEAGLIYVFSIRENKLLRTISCEKWTQSLCFKKPRVFEVGWERTIRCYNFRSKLKMCELPLCRDQTAFGSKGVKLGEIADSKLILANAGYGKFIIVDSKTNKRLASLDLAASAPSQRDDAPHISNYCLIDRTRRVAYLLSEDDRLLVFDYRLRKQLQPLRLFDAARNEENGLMLMNSILLEKDGFLFVVLQFAKSHQDRARLKAILYVVRVPRKSLSRAPSVLFHTFLPNLDYAVSTVVTRTARSRETGRLEFRLVLGSTRGTSTSMDIDITDKRAQCFDQLAQSEAEDSISGSIPFGEGMIDITASGKIIRTLEPPV
jgi:WD40 repeat protein